MPAGLVDCVCDHDALAPDAAAVADLLDLCIDEQVGVAALQRALPEDLDLLVEQRAEARYLRRLTLRPSDSTS